MRLQNYINESDRLTAETIANVLKRDCKPFLNELKHSPFLYRGTKRKIDDMRRIKSRISDRVPTDTDENVHKMVNDMFKKKFGWKVRNGVFTTGDIKIAADYGAGSPYAFFPIGKYSYVWSKDFGDFYNGVVDTDDFYLYSSPDIYEVHGERGLKDEWRKSKDDETYEEWITQATKKHKKRFDDVWKGILDTYTNKNLKHAIESKGEVSFNCKEYYLVNDDFDTELIDLL